MAKKRTPGSKLSVPSHESIGATPARRSIVTRKSGKQLRRLTLYLPPELARKLFIHSAARDVDFSTFVAEGMTQYLAKVGTVDA